MPRKLGCNLLVTCLNIKKLKGVQMIDKRASYNSMVYYAVRSLKFNAGDVARIPFKTIFKPLVNVIVDGFGNVHNHMCCN